MDPLEAAMPGALSLYNASGVFKARLRPFDVQRIEVRERIRAQISVELRRWVLKQGSLVPREMKEANGAPQSCMSAAGYDVPVGRAAARRGPKEHCVERLGKDESACIDEGSSGAQICLFG